MTVAFLDAAMHSSQTLEMIKLASVAESNLANIGALSKYWMNLAARSESSGTLEFM